MQYNKVTETQINTFKQIVGQPFVIVNDEDKLHYAHDYTEDLQYMPEVVVKPKTAEEVAAIVKVCYEHNIPITPRGAGTGAKVDKDLKACEIGKGVLLKQGQKVAILAFGSMVVPALKAAEEREALIESGETPPPKPKAKVRLKKAKQVAKHVQVKRPVARKYYL
jgi:glycolate oxidase